MSETAADFWTLPESTPAARRAAQRIRRRARATRDPVPGARRGLILALVAGALLGSALTAMATLPESRTPWSAGPAAVVQREIPGVALDREWRSYRTPVDVDRMFRSPRR